MADATNDARVNVYINGQSGVAEIEMLERKMLRLGKEINRVGKDSDLGKKLAAEMNLAQSEIDKLSKGLNLATMSMKQLETESKRLERLKKLAQPGTQEFKNLDRQLINVNARMKVVQNGMGSFGMAFKNLGNAMNGFFLTNPILLAVTALVGAFRGAVTGAGELSDQLADIQKTTGMTSREVKELNDELKQIDTRTSQKELLNMAVVAGQLGIAKKQVKGFVESVNVATVALGDEFTGGAQQVAEEMGKLRNVFTDFRSDNVDKDILRISNAINVLGAEGAATGPVVAENANRIGGFGIQAGLTTGQVLGLGAAMQELNINSERGSTAVVRILQKMLTDVETFAQVAGMSTQEFKKTLDTDLFGAFMKVVKGSKEVGTSNTALAKVIKELDVDGAGASEVMAKFGGNLELVEKKAITATNALKGQNSIMNEYNLKNTNAAAATEKIGKALSNWFSSTFVAAAEKFLVWLGQATGLTKTLSQQLEQERVELLMTESRLNNVNLKQADRVKLIKQLQDKYPDYLGNLDAEKVTNQELSRAIKNVNSDLINKIILQKKEEELIKKGDSAAAQALKNFELEKSIREKMIKLRDANSGVYIPQGDIIKQAQFVIQQMDARLNTFQKSNIFSDFNALKNDLRYYEASIKGQTFLTNQANEALKERDELAKQLGITLVEVADQESKTTAPTGGNTATVGGGSMPSDGKEAKAAKEFKLGVDLRVSEMQRYQAEVEKLQTEITNLHRSESEIAVSESTKKTDELLEENQRYQSELMFAIEFGSKAEREFAQNKLRELMREEEDLNAIRIRQSIEAEKKLELERVKTKKEALAMIAKATQGPMQQEIQEIESHYAELIALAIKYGVDTADLINKRNALIKGITDANNAETEAKQREHLQKLADNIGQYTQAAQNIIDPVVQIVSNSAEKKISEIENVTSNRMAQLDQQRSRGLINEEQYQKKKLALEKKTQKEIGQQRRKQAIADRIAAQANVIFSTAQAIMRAMASYPPPASYAFAAAAGVVGGLQSAAIWSAPMPTYRKGGVSQGPSHENGGISMINSQTGMKVGEMEGGEPYMILSRNTYANNRGVIDSLLNASMNEGGRMLRPDELMGNTPIMQVPRLSAGRGKRIVNREESGSGSKPPVWVDKMLEQMSMIAQGAGKEITAKVVLRDIEETRDEYKRIQDLANIGSSNVTTSKIVSKTSSTVGGGGTTTIIQEGTPGEPGAAGADGTGLELYMFDRP